MGDWSLEFHLQLIIVIKLFKEAYSNTLLLLDKNKWAKGKLDWQEQGGSGDLAGAREPRAKRARYL
jgi:hypothetical protein